MHNIYLILFSFQNCPSVTQHFDISQAKKNQSFYNILIQFMSIFNPILYEYYFHYIHLVLTFVKMIWWRSGERNMLSR